MRLLAFFLGQMNLEPGNEYNPDYDVSGAIEVRIEFE